MSPDPRPASMADEYNFDGLVGPTHNFAGLSSGNLASARHAQQTSHPRQAAMEGLAKMRAMVDLGLPQAVLPPHERPSLAQVRQLGYTGSLPEAVADLGARDPWLLGVLSSASAMWSANAATVSPSADTADGRVHFTAANLSATLHRSFEAPFTHRLFAKVFADTEHFVVHAPLPAHPRFADEGAANHGRLATRHGAPGIELFVYGRDDRDAAPPSLGVGAFPRRQTRLASESVAASHGLDPRRVVVVRQSAAAIDAGAFHNDVVAVTNGNVLFAHEDAFAPSDLNDVAGLGAQIVVVPRSIVSLRDAVDTYLFNSQLVTLPAPDAEGQAATQTEMALIAPIETAENPDVAEYLRALIAGDNPINAVHHVDVRQSMSNGGGPACLRLRVVLTPKEARAMRGNLVVDHAKLDQLEQWVNQHYRESLTPNDLRDSALLDETQTALDELSSLLGLGSIYDFQRSGPSDEIGDGLA